MKVPRYVMMGNCLVQCSLFRRQHDTCYACGKPGHWADVCINLIGNAASTAVCKTRRKTTNAHRHVAYAERRTPLETKGARKDSKSPTLYGRAAGSAAGSSASREIQVTRCSEAKQNKEETAPRRRIATGDAAPDDAPQRERHSSRPGHRLAPQLRPGHRAAAAPCGGGAPSEEPPQPRDAANRPRAGLVRRGHLSGRPRGRTRPGTTGPGPTEQWIRAGKPPRDREENQVTHAALAEHQQHKSKA